jgi:hypothetical protein
MRYPPERRTFEGAEMAVTGVRDKLGEAMRVERRLCSTTYSDMMCGLGGERVVLPNGQKVNNCMPLEAKIGENGPPPPVPVSFASA